MCDRCNDPTEFGTHLGSIKCTSCDSGYLLPPKWQCNSCIFSSDDKTVIEILKTSRLLIESAEMDVRKLEMINIKLSKILGPTHSMVIEVKQNIASILRDICVQSPTQPARGVLKRKLELCQEILPVLQKLQPGINRLTGIAMYETYVPLVQLAQRDYESREINTAKLLEYIEEGEKLLKQSIGMLLFEDVSVPEGQLARRAMVELKELRATIERVKSRLADENLKKSKKFSGNRKGSNKRK